MNLTIRDRHQYRRSFYCSSFWGAIGNSFTSATLVLFLADALGMKSGTFISWVYAAPFISGLLRLFLPHILKRFPARKAHSIHWSVMQVVLCWLMMGMCVVFYQCPEITSSVKFVVFILLWLLSALCENIACLVFLSWNGALFPHRTQGRFFARREFWRICGEVSALIFSGLILQTLAQSFPGGNFPKNFALPLYLFMMFSGTLFIVLSLFFYRPVPEALFDASRLDASRFGGAHNIEWKRLLKPFRSPLLRPILLYGALFSFFIQVEQVSQFKFNSSLTRGVVLPFFFISSLRLLTRVGQLSLVSFVGKWVDRFGSLRVMAFSQLLTALGPVFYLFTTSERFWLLYFSAFVWISYVGLNAALPKMQLEMADPEDDTPWLVVYASVGGLSGFVGVLLGGWIYQTFHEFPNYFGILFFSAFLCRAALSLPLFVAWWRKGKKVSPE